MALLHALTAECTGQYLLGLNDGHCSAVFGSSQSAILWSMRLVEEMKEVCVQGMCACMNASRCIEQSKACVCVCELIAVLVTHACRLLGLKSFWSMNCVRVSSWPAA